MQGLDQASTFKQLLFTYRGSIQCAAEKAEFNVCRATPAGAIGNPEICESKAANFLQCHHSAVKESKGNCASQYGAAFECLTTNAKSSSSVCDQLMDQFANCK